MSKRTSPSLPGETTKQRKARLYAIWRAKNRDKLKRDNAEWVRKNKTHVRAWWRNWYKTHKAQVRQHVIRYRTSNKAKYALATKHYDAQPHRRAARKFSTNRWRLNNPSKVKAIQKAANSKRKALMRGAKVADKNVDSVIRGWRRKRTFVCYYCQCLFPITRLHIDHIKAIAQGGHHTVENVCTSCDTCNLKKNSTSVANLTIHPQTLFDI